MDFVKLLRSLEEFLFETIALLFFYPVTLARIVLRPLEAMDYAEREEASTLEVKYDEAVSPPLLLLITLLLAYAAGLVTQLPQPPQTGIIERSIVSSPQNLLLFRSLLFSLIPLVAALTLLRKQKLPLSRETLRKPFFAQCYLAAPYALVVSIAGMLAQRPGEFNSAGAAAFFVLASAWLVSVQTRWFRVKLQRGLLVSFATAAGAFLRALIYLAVIAVLVVQF